MPEVINGLEECVGNGNCMKCQYGLEKQALSCKKLLVDALDLLKEQEARIEQLNRFINGFSRDAIPVVRCKDCKFRDTNGCRSEHSHVEWDGLIDEFYPDDDWYCADGERRNRNE